MDPNASFGRESVVARLEARTVTDPGPGEDPPAGHFEPAEEKYVVEAVIGAGGMAEVLLVHDRDLRRQVAMKVMSPEQAASPNRRLRFVGEAQATSQMEHPGIPPVHDIGLTPEGHPYFTMKLVRGRTLREVLRDLVLGRTEVRREFTLHRLVTVLERISEAVHFAHEKGVIHRDLKPENIMLGDYGEVHVMDWGIARVQESEAEPEERVATVGTDVGLMTLDGSVKGTVPYMSPEQAAGRVGEVDRRSDVYALGTILYEVLALQAAFEGSGLLERVQKGDVPPVRTRNPRRQVPEDLAVLTERSMAHRIERRPATARDFGQALHRWLDGSSERDRSHAEAEVLARRGRTAADRYQVLREEVDRAERKAAEAEAGTRPWQPVSEKRELLAARATVGEREQEMVLAFAEAIRLLEAALLAEEGNDAARAALADLWRMRLYDAEHRDDPKDVAYALRMMERYDDGRLTVVMRGDGLLHLTSLPDRAEVVLCEFLERDGILESGPEQPLGRTPIGPRPLAMGSYLCTVRKEGFGDVRYPVHITRNRAWSGEIRFHAEEEIGAEFVLVPGGPFLFGEGRDVEERMLPDFAIQRMPVTFADWAEFLAAVEEERGPEAAAARCPRTPGDGPYMERGEDGTWRPLANNVEGPTRVRCLREYGEGFERLLPVSGVTWQEAVDYCGWKSRTTGREWRLPTEIEREKAVRGVDGRRFPWGSLEDASLAKCRESRDEPPQPEPVGAFPTATSVYGMIDAVGSNWEWTDSVFGEHRSLRVLRGGAWDNASGSLRCTTGFGQTPEFRSGNFGFRCARSLPGAHPKSLSQ